MIEKLTARSAIAVAILAAMAPASAQEIAAAGRRPAISFEQLEARFARPDFLYAPFAFWFWDAPVDPAQTAAMAREMCRQGLNPGYAHARRGLPHEQWLSPRWFEAFGAALREAEAAGAYLGYCDEYWWPSGQADGRVLKAHPELEATSLAWVVRDLAGGEKVRLRDSLFTVAARRAEATIPAAARAARARLGKWIWHPTSRGDGATVFFQRELLVAPGSRLVAARMVITADDQYELSVNGAKLGAGRSWMELGHHEILPALRPGANTIAVRAHNVSGPCGLILGIALTYAGGRVERIASDETWRCRAGTGEEWIAPAVVGATAASAPWSLSAQDASHIPARIESATLKVIGAGAAFSWEVPAGSWRVYSFRRSHHAGIDGGRVNYIDRRLPGAFLAIAHEPYARAMGERMGRSIPGVFVDNEGDYGYKLAWSGDLEREYRAAKGRDIRRWMPLLIDEDVEGRWARARWDWHDAVSRLYTDNYLGGVSRWLAARGMYCISNLWEESLFLQAYAVGDFFRAQRAVTLPGNDCLIEKALQVHDFKETQSVSEFEGRRFQSEILGVAGWQMSPILMKRAVNHVIAWGVSHIVPHGINLQRDLGKIPYPPDWFTSNPYWRYLHLWNDFARRACFVNSHGELVPDVLLLNPMDSVWALLGGEVYRLESRVRSGGAEIDAIDRSYREAIDALSAARIEFLIADREYLCQMKVAAGGRLIRGNFEFEHLVLPPMVLLPLAAAEKIVAFAEAGGRVWQLGDLPRGSAEAGLGCPRMKALMKRLAAAPTLRRSTPQLAELEPQAVFESGAFALVQLHRRIDGRDFFWLVSDTPRPQRCALSFNGARGRASIWDCESGTIRPLASRATPAGSTVALEFAPYQAFWLVFDPQAKPIPARASEATAFERTPLPGPWRVHIEAAAQPVPVAPALGAPPSLLRPGGEVRPLASWLAWGLSHFSGYVDYRTEFTARRAGGRAILDLGSVRHMAEVFVNGQCMGARLWPPFAFEIGAAIRVGRNEVRVRVGNLLCNAMRQNVEAKRARWIPAPPRAEDFDAGLLGPVVLRRAR